MLQFVSVHGDGSKFVSGENIVYLGDDVETSVSSKYNYATDICLQALERGIGIATVPVKCVHNMLDGFPKNSMDLSRCMSEKWSKCIGSIFLVNRYTKFQDVLDDNK